MSAVPPQPIETTAPAGGGAAVWWGWAIGLPVCAAFGLLAGWAAALTAGVFSPLIVFPIVLGLLLGMCLVGAARLAELGHRPTLWAAALVVSASAVFIQHYHGYQEALRQHEREADAVQKALAKQGDFVHGCLPPGPSGPFDFLRRQAKRGRELRTAWGSWTAKGVAAWASWGVDAILVFLPCLGIVILGCRRPYCRECRSWYRTTRTGHLDGEYSGRVSRLVSTHLPPAGQAETVPPARFVLVSCVSGCGPIGFRLSWEGRSDLPEPAMVWLNDPKRGELQALLDEARRLASDRGRPVS